MCPGSAATTQSKTRCWSQAFLSSRGGWGLPRLPHLFLVHPTLTCPVKTCRHGDHSDLSQMPPETKRNREMQPHSWALGWPARWPGAQGFPRGAEGGFLLMGQWQCGRVRGCGCAQQRDGLICKEPGQASAPVGGLLRPGSGPRFGAGGGGRPGDLCWNCSDNNVLRHQPRPCSRSSSGCTGGDLYVLWAETQILLLRRR